MAGIRSVPYGPFLIIMTKVSPCHMQSGGQTCLQVTAQLISVIPPALPYPPLARTVQPSVVPWIAAPPAAIGSTPPVAASWRTAPTRPPFPWTRAGIGLLADQPWTISPSCPPPFPPPLVPPAPLPYPPCPLPPPPLFPRPPALPCPPLARIFRPSVLLRVSSPLLDSCPGPGGPVPRGSPHGQGPEIGRAHV